MTSALYTDADLHRLLYVSRTLDLDASVYEDCRCRSERCRQPYTFLREDGSVGAILSCSAGDAVVDALVDEGFGNREQPAGMELEFELIRRLDRAAEREALRLISAAGGPEGRVVEVALSVLERGAA